MSEITVQPGRFYRSINGREWTMRAAQSTILGPRGWIEMEETRLGVTALFRSNGRWLDGDPTHEWTLVEDVTAARTKGGDADG